MKQTITHLLNLTSLLFVILCTQANAQTGCHPLFDFHQTSHSLTIEFTDASSSPNTITSWLWDFGDGYTATEQNPVHTYVEPGTYQVCLTISDNHGCTTHACHHVVVHNLPEGICHAAFIAHQPDPEQQTIDFTDQSTSDGTVGSWSWDFGDGNTFTEQNPSHTYAHPGTYLVCLIITDDDGGCTDHVCHQVMVHHPQVGVCHAAFVAHQSNSNQQTIDFTDQSTSDGTIGTWSWDFGDGNTSTEQNPSHTYAHPGTYLVCLIITDDDGSCGDHVCHHIVVHHPQVGVCHAAFVAHQSNSNQQTLDCTDQSTSDGTIGSWSWDFGDGSTSSEQNPSHTYAHPGTYLVCLIITDDDGGCTNHVCHHVVVHHPQVGVCHAAFVAHQSNSNLQTLDFTDQSISDGTIGSWSWDFGDGSTSSEQNPSHSYAHPGAYLVCLIITDDDGGCTNLVCHHVVVHHPQAEETNVVHTVSTNDSSSDFRSNSSSPLHSHALVGQSSFHITTDAGNGLLRSQEYIVNYPNPFASSTTIQYELTDDADVKIEIYDMLGNRISLIISERESAGIHTQLISADKFNAGFYYIKMVVGEESFTKIITVTK